MATVGWGFLASVYTNMQTTGTLLNERRCLSGNSWNADSLVCAPLPAPLPAHLQWLILLLLLRLEWLFSTPSRRFSTHSLLISQSFGV